MTSGQRDGGGAAARRPDRRSAAAVMGSRGDLDSGCRCSLTALPSPVGDIVVLHVAGELDMATVEVVRTALDSALSVRQDTLVVDLTGVTFCGSRGLDVLIQALDVATDRGIRYVISGASAQARRLWTLVWPADRQPDQHPTVRLAVLAAMTRQTARRDRVRPSARGRLLPVPDAPPEPDTDRRLTERARAGDTEAYRALVCRHRRRMYRSALHTLGASDDPEDVDDDIAARLHTALAAFARADPR